jgi:heme exporter protein CcmD
MIDWLYNPHADYVLAAYAIALTALAGCALLSWRWAASQDKKWRQMQQQGQPK